MVSISFLEQNPNMILSINLFNNTKFKQTLDLTKLLLLIKLLHLLQTFDHFLNFNGISLLSFKSKPCKKIDLAWISAPVFFIFFKISFFKNLLSKIDNGI